MAASTGPILATGAIVVANRVVFNDQPMEWRVPVATGITALVFAGAESVLGSGVPRAVALVALVSVTLSRVDPTVPSPAESALRWWRGVQK